MASLLCSSQRQQVRDTKGPKKANWNSWKQCIHRRKA